MTPAKITGFSIQDFKRVRLVEIQPNENGLTIIGGRNAQGKSSCLDAIAYALGGEAFRPSDINNHDGGKNAAIRVEIDGLIVERAGKNAALKITDSRGMRGNQTLLNEIVGKFALDLGSFMRASNVEKAKMLLRMFPDLEQQLGELKTQADKIRTDRADVNRDIKRLQFQFDEMPVFPDLPAEEISIAELTQRLAIANNAERDLDQNIREMEDLKSEIDRLDQKITEADQEIANAEQALADFEASIDLRKAELQQNIDRAIRSLSDVKKNRTAAAVKLVEKSDVVEKQRTIVEGAIEKIREEISQADETNARIRKNAERRQLYGEIEKLRKVSDAHSGDLDKVDQARTVLLQNAELPLEELSINDEGELLYRGQQWDCMSGAERLKVATSICMKSKPGCGFVLIDGLEAMDPQTLAEFGNYLVEQNMQGIGTIVGEAAATVIIEDGRVYEDEAPAEPGNK